MTSPRFAGPIIPKDVEEIADWLDEQFGSAVDTPSPEPDAPNQPEPVPDAPDWRRDAEIAAELDARLRPLRTSLCTLNREQYNANVSMLRSSLIAKGLEQYIPLWFRELREEQFEPSRVAVCPKSKQTRRIHLVAAGIAGAGVLVVLASLFFARR